jgi:hypothetical protein
VSVRPTPYGVGLTLTKFEADCSLIHRKSHESLIRYDSLWCFRLEAILHRDRAANLAEWPQRGSSVTRITSTLRACANARTFLRSARSCFASEAISFRTLTIF